MLFFFKAPPLRGWKILRPPQQVFVNGPLVLTVWPISDSGEICRGALKNNVAGTAWPRKRWIRVVWAYRPILHCITYWVWVHSHWLLRNADKILKYEAEAPPVATDVCDHYQIALGLRRIRNQKLWCTKNRQNSDCGLPDSTHLTE